MVLAHRALDIFPWNAKQKINLTWPNTAIYKISKYFCVNTGLHLFRNRNDNRTATLVGFLVISLIEDFDHGNLFGLSNS